jgi:hypothetical protein
MPELGRKYTCYSCHTKFYDLGKPIPLCPKCGSDQRDDPLRAGAQTGITLDLDKPPSVDDHARHARPLGFHADPVDGVPFHPVHDEDLFHPAVGAERLDHGISSVDIHGSPWLSPASIIRVRNVCR